MAIEIVPKKLAKPAPWQDFLLYFLIFLLVIFAAGYFVLDFYLIKKAEDRFEELETKITQTKTPQQIALETELKNYQRKIEDFSSLLASHKKSSNFFDFLEKITHPKVFFSDLNLDTRGNNVQLKGSAENFRTLGEQLLMFRNTESIRNFRLGEVKIGKEGKIEFSFSFSLNPNLFTQ